jgi:hypothetical protein
MGAITHPHPVLAPSKWVHYLIDNANQSPIRKQARAIFPGWNELEEGDKFTLVELRRGVLSFKIGGGGWLSQDCAEICRRHSWRATGNQHHFL